MRILDVPLRATMSVLSNLGNAVKLLDRTSLAAGMHFDQYARVRARRFPLALLVRCRRMDLPEWCVGNTENISHSGALVRMAGTVQFERDDELDIRLILPNTAPGEPVEIACRGRVIRIVAPTPLWPSSGLAVGINRHRFITPDPIYRSRC